MGAGEGFVGGNDEGCRAGDPVWANGCAAFPEDARVDREQLTGARRRKRAMAPPRHFLTFPLYQKLGRPSNAPLHDLVRIIS